MQFQFNAAAVPPMQPQDPLPEGWYQALIKTSEGKPVKDKPQSGLLAQEFEVIDGQFRGRKVFNNLNLWNENQQACEIAGRELSAQCHVTGKFVIQDTSELHNIPMYIKVTLDGNQNRIKGYKDMQGNDPGKTGGTPNAQPQQMAPPPAAPPAAAWGNGQQQQQPGAASAWGGAPATAAAPAQQQQPAQGGWQGGGQQAAPAGAPAWGGGAAAPAAAPVAAPAQGGWGGAQQQPQGGGQPSWATPR